MYSTIVHSVSGPRSLSRRVSAPGWVPAAHVLRTVGAAHDAAMPTAASMFPATTRSTGAASAPPVSDPLPWATWTGSRPVVVDADGLALLAPAATTPRGHARVVVRSGPESGFAIAVPQGEWTLGRGDGLDVALTDPYLSRRPLALTNDPAGVAVGGTALHSAPLHDETADPPLHVIGSTSLTLAPSTERTAGTRGGGRAPDSASEPLSWPEPDEVSPVRSPSWIVYAAPIGIGVILALVIGTWWFLLLSLAGPATAAVTLRSERRRFARETAEQRRLHTRAVTRTLAALEVRGRLFSRRAEAIAYGGGTGAMAAPRRDELLVLGTGRCLSTVSVRLPRDPAARARARRRLPAHRVDGDTALLILEDAPLLLDRRTRIRVTGRIDRAEAIVRSLVTAHLSAGAGCIADESFPEFAGLGDPACSCRVTRGTLADSGSAAGTDTPVEATAAAEGSFEVCGPDADDAPVIEVGCGTPERPSALRVPDPAESAGTAHRPDRARSAAACTPLVGTPLSGPLHAHGMPRSTFLRLLEATRHRVPAQSPVGRGDATAATSVVDVLAQWIANGRPGAGPLAVPLGPPAPRPEAPRGTPLPGQDPARARPHGPESPQVEDLLTLLDLRASGPHALVAGTTGSGKSVLLEAWLDALCRTHAPADLRLVLLDFKGGASLGGFLRRPHTDCLVTDLDEAAALRAVRSVSAEIGRRERHLAHTGSRDIDDLLERSRRDPAVRGLPRLLVVIDEFHVLTSLSPHIVAQFEHLTAVGRSLGVHLVLATQRPAGVVSARMRANISLRICLRVRDEADSHEVLGVPDAAWVSPDLPGTALVSDDRGIRAFRSARPGDPGTNAASGPHVTVTSLPDSAEVLLPLPHDRPTLPAVEDGQPGPRHDVIAPALPTRLPQPDPTAIGLLDLPDENRVAHARLTKTSGSVTISGGRGRGWSRAVDACTGALHASGLPVIHVSPHADAPSVDADGILRLGHAQAWAIDHLMLTCERMRRPVVWAIDDWDEFVTAHQRSARADRLERLLTGSAGMRFVVSGHRRALAQRLSQTARTRIVFPPAADQDAVFFGLSASRFSGAWPPGRAVMLGEAALTDDRDGADVQIVQASGDVDAPMRTERSGPGAAQAGRTPQVPSARPHPLWSDFAPTEASPVRPSTHALPVGRDPAGTAVLWDPEADGHILTVLLAAEEPAGLTGFVDHLRDRGATVVLDAGDPAQRAAADAAAAARRPVCLVSAAATPPGTSGASRFGGPTVGGAAVGGASPLSSTSPDAAGPTLLLGTWSEDALRLAGHRSRAPIPNAADAHWWITGDTAAPIRLWSRTPLRARSADRGPGSCSS